MCRATKCWTALLVLLLLTGFTTSCALFQDEPAQVAEKFLRAAVANDLAGLQETVDPDQRDQVMQAILLQMGLSAFVGGAQSEYTELKVTTTSNDGQRALTHATGKLKTVTLGTPVTIPVDIQIPLVKKQGRWYVTSSATTMQPSALHATNPATEFQQTQGANTLPVTQGPNLQATIDTLQTQVAGQQTLAPAQLPTTPEAGTLDKLIIGKWGVPEEQKQADKGYFDIEFFQDGTFNSTSKNEGVVTEGKYTFLGPNRIKMEVLKTTLPMPESNKLMIYEIKITGDKIELRNDKETLLLQRVK
jgi:hypothetical protein